MLNYPLAHLEAEIQPWEPRITMFVGFNGTQRLDFVFEALAKRPHHTIERLFPGVREGGMAYVVGERERFRQVFIQPQCICHGAGDLRDLDRMSKAVTKMIRQRGREDLRLMFQPPESARMNNAVAIALERVAIRMFGLRVPAAARLLNREPQVREHYLDGNSESAVTAAWLASVWALASATSNLRASSVCVGTRPFARANCAWLFETRSVG